jgi:hypothetical protein
MIFPLSISCCEITGTGLGDGADSDGDGVGSDMMFSLTVWFRISSEIIGNRWLEVKWKAVNDGIVLPRLG